MRHLATNSDTQVIAPADTSFLSLAFSGNYIYFRKAVDRHIQLVDVSLLDADEAGEPARDLGRST
jgi:hypothetical protein